MKRLTIAVDNNDLILITQKMFERLKVMTLEVYPDIDLNEVFLDSYERFLGHIFEVGLITYQKASPINEMFLYEIAVDIEEERRTGSRYGSNPVKY
jgi:hypothetical protein